jgi:hypothetical protein
VKSRAKSQLTGKPPCVTSQAHRWTSCASQPFLFLSAGRARRVGRVLPTRQTATPSTHPRSGRHRSPEWARKRRHRLSRCPPARTTVSKCANRRQSTAARSAAATPASSACFPPAGSAAARVAPTAAARCARANVALGRVEAAHRPSGWRGRNRVCPPLRPHQSVSVGQILRRSRGLGHSSANLVKLRTRSQLPPC